MSGMIYGYVIALAQNLLVSLGHWFLGDVRR